MEILDYVGFDIRLQAFSKDVTVTPIPLRKRRKRATKIPQQIRPALLDTNTFASSLLA
jgi:hypothetical protein